MLLRVYLTEVWTLSISQGATAEERPGSATTTHRFHPTNIGLTKLAQAAQRCPSLRNVPNRTFAPGFGPWPRMSPARQRWPRLRLAEEGAGSAAGTLGRTWARSPGARPRYGPANVGANVFLTPEEAKSASAEPGDRARLKWLLARWSRWSGMSRLTFEEKAPIVVHVHSMIPGGW